MNPVIDIWRHMTWREKGTAFAAALFYGCSLGLGMACIISNMPIPGNDGHIWKAIVAVFVLVLLVRGFMHWQKRFYASTVWARAHGVTTEDMNVTDFYNAAFWSVGLRKKN